MDIKVGFVSLGCPKNLINTEVMLAKLANSGFEIVADDVEADVIVINTCAFIESAKQEAINNILDIAWLKENHTLKGIVVTGCLSERYREELFKELPEVDCILGTGSYDEIVEAVTKAYNKTRFSALGDINAVKTGGERVVTTPEHFAYLQISEGCDNCCSYCVIPSIRGKYRSRAMSEILEEAQDLANLGIKEICLIAQDTTRYGEDLFGTSALDSLLREISEIDGIEWIRLLYCYPHRITDELIEEIASNNKVLKYIDIPIQHIDDQILAAMNRRDTGESIEAVINKMRERIPGLIVRSTAIVGFPGETDAMFEKLEQFIKKIKFERFGIFEYSREEGTPAYNFDNQISETVKRKRYDRIMKLQKNIAAEYNKKQIGKSFLVICEGYDQPSECFFGRSYADAPDIDGKIFFESNTRLKEGDFVNILITKAIDYDLFGKYVATDEK